MTPDEQIKQLQERNDELTNMLITAYRTLNMAADITFKDRELAGYEVRIAHTRDLVFHVLKKEKTYREIKG